MTIEKPLYFCRTEIVGQFSARETDFIHAATSSPIECALMSGLRRQRGCSDG
jgi:hypothetical protein